MSTHTSLLLKECNEGCKMAIACMDQVMEFVHDEALQKLIGKYKYSHESMEEESSELLKEKGLEEKEPNLAEKAFSWVSTETKLVIKNSDNQISKVLMDGCNMQIEALTEQLHKHEEASKEAKKLTERLIKLEEEMRKELKHFL